MTECNCTMQCDPVAKMNPRHCCGHCFEQLARRDKVPEPFRSQWTPTTGFWREDGCCLDMEHRPQDCRDYDCHKHVHISVTVWVKDRWRSCVIAIPNDKVNAQSLLLAGRGVADQFSVAVWGKGISEGLIY